MPRQKGDTNSVELKWVKMYLSWLFDETFLKWTHQETLTYWKFVCLAAKSKLKGVLYYSDDQISRECHEPLEFIKSFKKKLCGPEKINPLTNEPEGQKAILLQGGYLKLLNYEKYQPDWQRIKKYSQSDNAVTYSLQEEEVFKHWLHSGCMKHDNIADHYNAITKALTKYTIDQIKEAITNYGQIINDDTCWYKHSYRLKDFMTRGMETFFTNNNPFTKYKKQGSGKQGDGLDIKTRKLLEQRERKKGS